MTRPVPQTPTTRYIQAEEGARITALRARRTHLDEIARLTGRAPSTITRYLDRQGVPRNRAPVRRTLDKRARRITVLAMRGLSECEVAKAMKLTMRQVSNCSSRYALFTTQALNTLSDLGRETGLARGAIYEMIDRGELEASRWFRLRVFTPAQFEAAQTYIKATYISRERAKGWITTEKAARELSMGVDLMLRLLADGDARVAGIVRRRVIGMGGQVWRYDPATVLAAAQHLPQRNLPLEYTRPLVLRVEDVAPIVQRSHDAVTTWARLGAPHLRDRTRRCGRIWFHLPTLQTWLAAQEHVNYQRAAANLAQHLTVAQAVAS